MSEVKFNINEIVKVKLTDFGVKVLKQSYTRYGLESLKIIKDEEGYTKFQMWELMSTYGKYMGLARENVFDLNIKIVLKEEL